jgi:activator of 2-hydroxyglutaryl-CoA dehydratase
MNLQINKQLSTNSFATLNQYNRIRQTNKQRNREIENRIRHEERTTKIAPENTKNTKKKNVPSVSESNRESHHTREESNTFSIGIDSESQTFLLFVKSHFTNETLIPSSIFTFIYPFSF